MRIILFYFLLLLSQSSVISQNVESYPIVIVGGGASGSMAAIQSARMGIKSLIIEETDWVGGMLTAAGVSAIDGNHKMPSGLWGEFRDSLYRRYGGPKAVETGWVSNTLFEPSVGRAIISHMIENEKNIYLSLQSKVLSVQKTTSGYTLKYQKNGKTHTVNADYLIDATELGDMARMLNIPRRIGMDASSDTGESWAPTVANNLVQDLTYVVVLKDYGKGSDKTIAKPSNYNPALYKCCCDTADPSTKGKPRIDCSLMMTYGKLPNNKYMINWPNCGNDYYVNMINLNDQQRAAAVTKAKEHSLGFIYFLQTELGYKNLGLADDEYTTPDKLPLMPYHRESGRIQGHVLFTANHIMKPYDYTLYRTGVAVGDYPIDHHHKQKKDVPIIDFFDIKAPSYNLPIGSLIPKGHDRLIIAEKSISVSNIVNGASRLQPVVLGIGQAAGVLAAVAVKNNAKLSKINIREVQNALLQSNAYIMPFFDVPLSDSDFKAIQRLGALGIVKGEGIPYKWANQTWFYPEKVVSQYELVNGMRPYYQTLFQRYDASGEPLTLQYFYEVLLSIGFEKSIAVKNVKGDTPITRRQLARLIDTYLSLFTTPIDLNGAVITKN
jgi:hypothetical protein